MQVERRSERLDRIDVVAAIVVHRAEDVLTALLARRAPVRRANQIRQVVLVHEVTAAIAKK